MNILFLDDDPIRHEIFQHAIARAPTRLKRWHRGLRSLCGRPLEEVPLQSHLVFDIEPAIQALQSSPRQDIAFLDHDLNGEIYVERREGTGTEVAEFIAAMPALARPRLVIVHSFNPHGARRMMKILQGCGCLARQYPFGSPDFLSCLPTKGRENFFNAI